ncbi:MAG: hypothetical protein LBR10_11785 [Prevotellaceae bacterium]|jgi:hypothetical protein|nr:hypothetical protein [Prevotellaceae bacterium]
MEEINNMNNMNSKKILYLDMDNVLVDFASGILSDKTKRAYEGNLDDVPGINNTVNKNNLK